MPELSLENIDQISRDIRRQEITFSHLLEDLVDHICCDVEYEMQQGLNFMDAYRRVRQKMGSRRLKEIQEETLYAVDNKYRKMKNTMKISGIAGAVMLGFSAMLKIMHLPGAGPLLTLGALILALLFMPSALTVLWKETHSGKRLFLFITAFLAGASYILGMLFKVQHWPGAGLMISLSVVTGLILFLPSLLLMKIRNPENPAKLPVYVIGVLALGIYVAGFWLKIMHWPLAGSMMTIGSALIFLLVFPWYAWLTWKEESHITVKFIFIVVASLLFIIPAALVGLNIERSYEEGFFIQQEQQADLVDFRLKSNESFVELYRDSSQYQGIEELHSKTTGLINLIDGMETNMVQIAEGKPDLPVPDPEQIIKTEYGPRINYRLLSRPFHPGPAKVVLIPGSGSRQELDAALTEYKEYLSDQHGAGQVADFESLLSSSTYLPVESQGRGELALMPALHAMTLLKNGVLTAEAAFLRMFTSN